MPRTSDVPTVPDSDWEVTLPTVVIDGDIPGQGRLFDEPVPVNVVVIRRAHMSARQAQRLREARRSARLSSQEVCDRTGLDPSVWWNALLGVEPLDDETERRVLTAMFALPAGSRA